MGRRLGLTLSMLLAAAPAWADGPVCAQRPVLERLHETLREAGRKVAIVPGSVGEFSAGLDRVVHCAARGTVLGYDTAHYGPRPIETVLVIRYALDLRQNGIFLRLE